MQYTSSNLAMIVAFKSLTDYVMTKIAYSVNVFWFHKSANSLVLLGTYFWLFRRKHICDDHKNSYSTSVLALELIGGANQPYLTQLPHNCAWDVLGLI